MNKIFQKHKSFWKNKELRQSFAFGLFLLLLSFVANYYANVFTNMRASNSVADLFLDNLPVVNVGFVFFECFVGLIIFYAYLLLRVPERMPFGLKSIALFVVVRSIFISLTHIGHPPFQSFLEFNHFFFDFTGGNDLFFSSHTGLPWLMALMFWENKILRNLFLSISVFFGVIVLLGHLHYSIDVFAAPFITYSIFRLAQLAFPKDFEIFRAVEGK